MLYYFCNCFIFLLAKIFQLSHSSFENIFETGIIYKTIYFYSCGSSEIYLIFCGVNYFT